MAVVGEVRADLNCLVFSAEMSATFKFNVASLLLLLCSAVVDASYASLLVCSFFRLFAVLQQSLFYLEVCVCVCVNAMGGRWQ